MAREDYDLFATKSINRKDMIGRITFKKLIGDHPTLEIIVRIDNMNNGFNSMLGGGIGAIYAINLTDDNSSILLINNKEDRAVWQSILQCQNSKLLKKEVWKLIEEQTYWVYHLIKEQFKILNKLEEEQISLEKSLYHLIKYHQEKHIKDIDMKYIRSLYSESNYALITRDNDFVLVDNEAEHSDSEIKIIKTKNGLINDIMDIYSGYINNTDICSKNMSGYINSRIMRD